MLARAESAVNELLKKNKPVRITVGRIGATLGLKALLEKHLDKLPKSKVYLESVVETVEDFQIRRIHWAVGEVDRQGEEILEWKILRLAGLRENCNEKIQAAISLCEPAKLTAKELSKSI